MTDAVLRAVVATDDAPVDDVPVDGKLQAHDPLSLSDCAAAAVVGDLESPAGVRTAAEP
ncbi:hypothetical protein [Streptomyces sp. NBC_00356]|uniref:hypothetical protein n=1 Tax=Streptomyces sp. NBC_00356 TaxID=2975724 RepID=UPI002E26B789